MTDQELKDIRSFIIKHEGVRQQMYYDNLGIPTIGVGLNMLRPDAKERLKLVSANYDSLVKRKSQLDLGQIEKLLDMDIQDCLTGLKTVFSDFETLPFPVRKVLVDMVFNLGITRFKGFPNTIADLKKSDWKAAAAKLKLSKWANQVPKRAKENIAILESV